MERLKSLIQGWQKQREIARTKDKIKKWGLRADMARQQGADDLALKALEHKQQCEKRLEELT